MNWLRKEEWPWWQTGLLLGLLNIATFYVSDYYLSVSTTFSRVAAMLVSLAAPDQVAANAYWQNVKPVVDWQFMFVIGIPIGAYIGWALAPTWLTFEPAVMRSGVDCNWRSAVGYFSRP